jgi:hypothetical protein
VTIEIKDCSILPSTVSGLCDNMDWLNVASILGIGTSHNLWVDNAGTYFYLVSPEHQGSRQGIETWSRTPQIGKQIGWNREISPEPTVEDRSQVMALAYQYVAQQAINEVRAEFMSYITPQ